jgi:hypothetical protein
MNQQAIRTFRRPFWTIAALLISAALTHPVQAQDWKAVGEFGWMGVGKAYEIDKGHYFWVGEFTGTFFNDKGKGSLFHRAGVKCPAYNDLNFPTGKSKAGGFCVITDKDGDKAYLSWSNEGDGTTGPGTFTYTGGTGKYSGISGTNKFIGVTEVNWSDGTATGYATWNR